MGYSLPYRCYTPPHFLLEDCMDFVVNFLDALTKGLFNAVLVAWAGTLVVALFAATTVVCLLNIIRNGKGRFYDWR